MPQPRAWSGDKLVPQEILRAYNTTVDERIAAAKTAAIAAAEKKDQNLMGDVESKITAEVDEAWRDLSTRLDTVAGDLTEAFGNAIDDLTGQVATNNEQSNERDRVLTENLNALATTVESLPTIDEVNSAISSNLTSVYQFKGSVADYASLPTGYGVAQTGWVYNTEDTGMNYAWTGTAWDSLGGDKIITQLISPSEYNTILHDKTIPEAAVGKLVGSDAYLGLRLAIPDPVSTETAETIVVNGVVPSGHAGDMATADSLRVLRDSFPMQQVAYGTLQSTAWAADPDNEGSYRYSVQGLGLPLGRAYMLCLDIPVESTVGYRCEFSSQDGEAVWTTLDIYSKVIPVDIVFEIVDMGNFMAPMERTPFVVYTGGISGAISDGGGTGGGDGTHAEFIENPVVMKASWTASSDNTKWTYTHPLDRTAKDSMFFICLLAGPESTIRVTSYDDTSFTLTSYVTPPAMLIMVIYKEKTNQSDLSILVPFYGAFNAMKAMPIAAGGTGGTTATDALKGLISPLTNVNYGSNDYPSYYIPVYEGNRVVKASINTLRQAMIGTGTTIQTSGGDYTTIRGRGISFHTAMPSALRNGCIYGIYS